MKILTLHCATHATHFVDVQRRNHRLRPLGPSDALVWIGCSPPESRYFAWDVVDSMRFLDANGSFFWPGCPFGDAVNFKTAGKGFGWSSPFTMVHAFDQSTVDQVSEASRYTSHLERT